MWYKGRLWYIISVIGGLSEFAQSTLHDRKQILFSRADKMHFIYQIQTLVSRVNEKDLAEGCTAITHHSAALLAQYQLSELSQTEESHQNVWKGLLTLFFHCYQVYWGVENFFSSEEWHSVM